MKAALGVARKWRLVIKGIRAINTKEQKLLKE